MSLIAIPEMRKRKYPDWMSAGIVASGEAFSASHSTPLVNHLWCCNGVSMVRLYGGRHSWTTARTWDVYNNHYRTSRVPR